MRRVQLLLGFYRLACNLGLRNRYYPIHNDNAGKEFIKLFNHQVYLDDIERKGYNQCVRNLIMAK